MKKFKKILVCMLAAVMLLIPSFPVQAATAPAAPKLSPVQMTSSGHMSISWRSVSNADGYKINIYNFYRKKTSTIYVAGRYNTNYYTKQSPNTAYLVSVRSYRYVSGRKVFSTDYSSFTCTPRAVSKVSSTSNTMTVKWPKLYGISGYYVYKSTSPNSGFKYAKTLSANATSVKINSMGTNTYFYITPYKIFKGKKYKFPAQVYRYYKYYYYR